MSAKSDTRFAVIVEGSVRRYYDSATEAISFARQAVYLASERLPDVEHFLATGQIAEWSYGFCEVQVFPPRAAIDKAGG